MGFLKNNPLECGFMLFRPSARFLYPFPCGSACGSAKNRSNYFSPNIAKIPEILRFPELSGAATQIRTGDLILTNSSRG